MLESSKPQKSAADVQLMECKQSMEFHTRFKNTWAAPISRVICKYLSLLIQPVSFIGCKPPPLFPREEMFLKSKSVSAWLLIVMTQSS